MNVSKIYEGDFICDGKYKGRYIFLKTGEKYVFLDKVNSVIDLAKLKVNKFYGLILDTDESKFYYIDSKSLKHIKENFGISTL